MTEANLEKALEYVGRKMIADAVDPRDMRAVVVWMIENPLPTKAEYEAEMAQLEADDKAARIVALQAELTRLQG